MSKIDATPMAPLDLTTYPSVLVLLLAAVLAAAFALRHGDGWG